jgi:ADP-heptose:LPS heptosyltransferase
LQRHAAAAAALERRRYAYLPALLDECATLEELCAVVRNARWVISTDTGMMHLADAFEVPCLAFFPTHRPDWRVRDYPRCVPIALRSALLPGLEFARGAGDHGLARQACFRTAAISAGSAG